MTFLRSVDGCHAHWSDVGSWQLRPGNRATVPVNVWAFTEGLVVAADSALPWRRVSQIGPLKGLTPDDIASLYHRPVFLEHEGLDHIDIGAGRGTRKLIRFGVDHVIFDMPMAPSST